MTPISYNSKAPIWREAAKGTLAVKKFAPPFLKGPPSIRRMPYGFKTSHEEVGADDPHEFKQPEHRLRRVAVPHVLMEVERPQVQALFAGVPVIHVAPKLTEEGRRLRDDLFALSIQLLDGGKHAVILYRGA